LVWHVIEHVVPQRELPGVNPPPKRCLFRRRQRRHTDRIQQYPLLLFQPLTICLP
jgi:hypothetical protein